MVLLLAGCDFSSKGIAIGTYENSKKALLVLDMQDDFIGEKARMPVMKNETAELINVVNRAIEKNKAEGNIIVYIRNAFPKTDISNLFRNNAALEGTPGTNINDAILIESENIFDKKVPDAFSNIEFEKFLIKNQVNEIERVGVFADQCVFYTSKSALNRKYKVYYVKNGVAGNSEKAKENAVKRIEKAGAEIIAE